MPLPNERTSGKRRAVFLGGGGSEIEERPVWCRFLLALGGPRVLYVPQALGDDRRALSEAELWFREALRTQHPDWPIEVSVSRDLSEVDLFAYDGVFLGGGNTAVLRAAIARTGMDDAIRAYSAAGKPIYGGSAGAIVLGRWIDVSEVRPATSLSRSVAGLDLLGGLTCCCHDRPADTPKVLAYVVARQAAVLALPEDGGAVFDGDGIEALGAAPIAIFRPTDGARLALQPGERSDRRSWTSLGVTERIPKRGTHG